MALNIANRKVEEKAVRVCRITGANKTVAVELALDYYLAHHPAGDINAAVRREVALLLDEISAIPVLDERSPEEIVGYDKSGLI